MNKKDMNLIKIQLAILIMFIFCIIACAGLQTTSPPTPVVKWSFDVSKRDSTVNQEFRIVEYRSYYLALRFDCLIKGRHDNIVDDGDRLLVLLDHDTSGRLTGINIPIHLKISKLDTASSPPQLIYEGTILTKRKYASAYEYYLREIIAINLKPGIYGVEANTIEDRPEFSGTPSYLQIEWHSKIKFLLDEMLVK